MGTRLLPLVVALCALAPASAAPPPSLPLPLGRGGGCALLVPCARSDDLAGHLRGTLLVLDIGGQARVATQLGLSVSLWRWAELGATWFQSAGNGDHQLGWRQGPTQRWGRFSPPPLSALLCS